MKFFWTGMFAFSSIVLLTMMLRRSLPQGWLTRFGVHLVLSAMAIYALNFSGWMTGIYIPLNPVTIGAVALLGLPGVALVAGMQWSLLT